MENYDIKNYIQEKFSSEDEAENLIYEFIHIDLNKTPKRGLGLLKRISESKEEAARVFIHRLKEHYTEIAKEMGI
jgi:hypothetical protein